MKLKCILLISIVAQVCNVQAAGFEDHITQHYSALVESIEQCGIRGPLAGEIVQSLRQCGQRVKLY